MNDIARQIFNIHSCPNSLPGSAIEFGKGNERNIQLDLTVLADCVIMAQSSLNGIPHDPSTCEGAIYPETLVAFAYRAVLTVRFAF